VNVVCVVWVCCVCMCVYECVCVCVANIQSGLPHKHVVCDTQIVS